MKLGQNWPKIESYSPDKILHQKAIDVFKMTKKAQFSAKVLRFLVVLTKNHKKWAKSDLKLAKHS